MPEEERKGFFKKIGDWADESARASREMQQRRDDLLPWDNATDWYRRAPVGAVHVKEYKENDRSKMNDDIKKAASHGWEIDTVGEQSGHINVGRTVTTTALTGGLRLFFGASRTKGFTMLRFTRTRSHVEALEQPGVQEGSDSAVGANDGDVIKQIERLAELNRAGALTDEEFAAKKAELLSRL